MEFFCALFADNKELLDKVLKLLKDERMVMEKEREAREDTIKRALNLIADHSRYEREIVDRPTSKDEAKRLLDIDKTAVAFHYTPSKGNDKGRKLLVFSTESLKRLIRRVGCSDDLLDAVLARAGQLHMLDDRSRTIRLGKGTFTAVTFFDE